MKCRVCNEEIMFVKDSVPGADAFGPTRTRAFHNGINLHDRDTFGAGAKIVHPSNSTQHRLRRELEQRCGEDF